MEGIKNNFFFFYFENVIFGDQQILPTIHKLVQANITDQQILTIKSINFDCDWPNWTNSAPTIVISIKADEILTGKAQILTMSQNLLTRTDIS